MNAELKEALAAYLLALADDELILAHRDSEWTGHAPILEEDIAFSNIAQDELGHASIFYRLHHELTNSDADQLVFFRKGDDYRNIQMVELPRGDWSFTIVRQYLFDAYELVRTQALLESKYAPLSGAAARIYNEEIYHLRHTGAWIRRLGLGTEKSQRLTQRSLDNLWPFALQLFVRSDSDELLIATEFIPDPLALYQRWSDLVIPQLSAAALNIPDNGTPAATSREHHTDHLVALLAEMQEVARLDPAAQW